MAGHTNNGDLHKYIPPTIGKRSGAKCGHAYCSLNEENYHGRQSGGA